MVSRNIICVQLYRSTPQRSKIGLASIFHRYNRDSEILTRVYYSVVFHKLPAWSVFIKSSTVRTEPIPVRLLMLHCVAFTNAFHASLQRPFYGLFMPVCVSVLVCFVHEYRYTNNGRIGGDFIAYIRHCHHALGSFWGFFFPLFHNARNMLYKTNLYLLHTSIHQCFADLRSALNITQHVTAASLSACFGKICHCSRIIGLQNHNPLL